MLVHLTNWQNPSKRRLEAIRAAHERDEEALWQLVVAFVGLYGRKQSLTSPNTFSVYRVALKDYLQWCWPVESLAPQLPILRATRDDIARYVVSLQQQGSNIKQVSGEPVSLSPNSIALRLSGVRMLYRALEWAEAATLPDGLPTVRDPTPPEERRPALPLSLYRQLLKHLDTAEPKDRRDRIAARLAGEVGLRVSEVVGLETPQVQLAQRLIVVRGKGGKSRSVPLDRSLAAELEDWLRLRAVLNRSSSPKVILRISKGGNLTGDLSEWGLRYALNGHYQTLGFPERYHGVHQLRHTAGTRYYRGTRDLFLTARLLGHTNVNTSSIYAKMDLEGLAAAVDSLEPIE